MNRIIFLLVTISLYAYTTKKNKSELVLPEKIIYHEYEKVFINSEVEHVKTTDTVSVVYERVGDSVYLYKTFDKNSNLITLDSIDFARKWFTTIINDTFKSCIIGERKVYMDKSEIIIYKVVSINRISGSNFLSYWTIEDGKIFTKIIGGEGYCRPAPKLSIRPEFINNQEKNNKILNLCFAIFVDVAYSVDFCTVSRDEYNQLLKSYRLIGN